MTAVEWRSASAGWLVRAGCASHVGNYRERNEDHVYLDPDHPFALVLDGMGGQNAGEIASVTGAEAVAGALRAGLKAGEEPHALIERALRTGNEAVLALGRSLEELKHCGATVVFAFLAGEVAWVSWLGDSPAFRLSANRIEKLTWEHDLRNALIRNGTFTAEEARYQRIKNVIWKYLGVQELEPPLDVVSFVPRPGDVLLLTTDGISNTLPEAEVLMACRAYSDPRYCAEELIARALDGGSRDNCTCAVLTFEWTGPGTPPESHQEAGEFGTSEPPRKSRGRWWQFWK